MAHPVHRPRHRFTRVPQTADPTKLERGFVLLTRATGHGKRTTLAVMIDKINQKRDAHAVTVKDPVGFLFQHHRALWSGET